MNINVLYIAWYKYDYFTHKALFTMGFVYLVNAKTEL